MKVVDGERMRIKDERENKEERKKINLTEGRRKR